MFQGPFIPSSSRGGLPSKLRPNTSSKSSQILVAAKKSMPFTLFDCLWIPNTPKMVALGEKARRNGSISILKMGPSGSGSLGLTLDKEILTERGIKCGSFDASRDGISLAMGDFVGTVMIHDIEKNQESFSIKKAHNGEINGIAGIGNKAGHGAPEIATCGGRDGYVRIWDPRVNSPVCEIQCQNNLKSPLISKRVMVDDEKKEEGMEFDETPSVPKKSGTTTKTDKKMVDCWSVTFGNSYDQSNRIICAGFANGDIKMVDLKMNRVHWQTNIGSGVCSVEFDRKDTKLNKLVATGLDSRMCVFDVSHKHAREGYPRISMKGSAHDPSTIWKGKHMPQNRDIWGTCHGDGSIRIWKYTYPDQRIMKNIQGDGKEIAVMGSVEPITVSSTHSRECISTQPIVAMDWHPRKTGLSVCASLDQQVRVILVTGLK